MHQNMGRSLSLRGGMMHECSSLACVPAGSQLTCVILRTVVIGGVFHSAVADTLHFRKLIGGRVGLHGGAVQYQRPFFQFPWGSNSETTA